MIFFRKMLLYQHSPLIVWLYKISKSIHYLGIVNSKSSLDTIPSFIIVVTPQEFALVEQTVHSEADIGVGHLSSACS